MKNIYISEPLQVNLDKLDRRKEREKIRERVRKHEIKAFLQMYNKVRKSECVLFSEGQFRY